MRIKALCWNYEGDCIRAHHSSDGKGYPQIMRHGKRTTIARSIVLRRHGELPSSVVTRHTCDNKWCINPNHLIIGTQIENIGDRVSRGRNRDQSGSKNNMSKLTENQVAYIRGSPKTQRALAEELGVHYMTVHYAKRGITWKGL